MTHSLKESIMMGDSIAHLRRGILETFATKEDFLRDPESGVEDELRFWDALRGHNQ